MKKEMALANRYENGLRHGLKYVVLGTGGLHKMDPAIWWADGDTCYAFGPELGTIKRETAEFAGLLADLVLEGYTVIECGLYED